jgi:S-adenosylmethionine uptake transporter
VALLGIALLSGMDAVMKGLVLGIGAFATMLWRSFIGVLLSGTIYAAGGPARPTPAGMKLHVGRGVLTTVMGLLFFWGVARVPLAQAIALAFIAPLLALVLAAWFLGERVGRRTVAASLTAFAGVLVILLGQARADLGTDALLGSGAVLASALLYAINIILMRRQSLAARPAEIAFYQNATVAAVLLLAWPVMGGGVPAVQHWPALVLSAGLSTSALLLLGWAYARGEASYLAASEYSGFLWAALFGWWVFGEHVSVWTMAGAALIIAGCAIAARPAGDCVPLTEGAI